MLYAQVASVPGSITHTSSRCAGGLSTRCCTPGSPSQCVSALPYTQHPAGAPDTLWPHQHQPLSPSISSPTGDLHTAACGCPSWCLHSRPCYDSTRDPCSSVCCSRSCCSGGPGGSIRAGAHRAARSPLRGPFCGCVSCRRGAEHQCRALWCHLVQGLATRAANRPAAAPALAAGIPRHWFNTCKLGRCTIQGPLCVIERLHLKPHAK